MQTESQSDTYRRAAGVPSSHGVHILPLMCFKSAVSSSWRRSTDLSTPYGMNNRQRYF